MSHEEARDEARRRARQAAARPRTTDHEEPTMDYDDYTDDDRDRDIAALRAESDRVERERNLTNDDRPAGTVTKHQARRILDSQKAIGEAARASADPSLTASQRQAAALRFGDD